MLMTASDGKLDRSPFLSRLRCLTAYERQGGWRPQGAMAIGREVMWSDDP
jgi:hypothetical protein